MITAGTKDATLREVRVVDIHGTRFYDVVYTLDEAPGQPQAARVGAESIYPTPRPGDAVAITYLMNVVVNITPRAT